jgi:hypothetical protein
VLPQCPDPSVLKQSYNTIDYASAPTWTVQVRDNVSSNGSSEFYSDAGTAAAPHWDSNGDGKLWVRATATVNGKTRAVVGLVKVDLQTEDIPHSTLIAGSLTISNTGNKALICTTLPDDPTADSCSPSSSSLIGPVDVRCTDPNSSQCLSIRPGTPSPQIAPYSVQTGYTGGTSLSPAALYRMRTRAVADGTYYSGSCPPSMAGPQAGMVVFVDNASCSYTDNQTANSLAAPGVFIVNNGTLSMGGTVTFFGIVYATNPPAANPTVSLSGNASVVGGVQIDGNGQMVAGSSHTNLVFDDAAFGAVRSYGAAHLVQNKWREFVPSGP